MVLNCVAYGCNNLHHPSKMIPFHTFPFKRPEILKLWISAIQRDNWKPSKTSRLCGQHFLESDYKINLGGTAKLLKCGAVPSVFSFSKHVIKQTTTRRVLIQTNTETANPNPEAMETNIDLNNVPFTSVQEKTSVDAGTQTNVSHNYLKVYSWRRTIKSLKQKVKRRDLKISNMKELIGEISKNHRYSNEDLNSVLKKYFQCECHC